MNTQSSDNQHTHINSSSKIHLNKSRENTNDKQVNSTLFAIISLQHDFRAKQTHSVDQNTKGEATLKQSRAKLTCRWTKPPCRTEQPPRQKTLVPTSKQTKRITQWTAEISTTPAIESNGSKKRQEKKKKKPTKKAVK